MKNKLLLAALVGVVSTIALPKANTYAQNLPKVDIQGEFVSFHDIVSGMKGTVSLDSKTTTYLFSVQDKTFELNHLSGYAIVDGKEEPYQLKVSESDETVVNVVRVSPVLFEEELYVPIEFVERFLDLTYEDGNFESDDEIMFEGDEDQTLVTPPVDNSTETSEDSTQNSDESTESTTEESQQKPEQKPETTPEQKPEQKPETTPEVNKPNQSTGGNNSQGNDSTGGNTTKPEIKPVVVESISVDRTSITMTHGGTDKITAKVNPFNVPDTSITYSSNNTNIVTADKSGNLKAVGVGTTTITVISNYTPTVRTTITVTVNPVAVTGLSLSKGNTTLDVGGTLSVSATVSPSNATNKGVTWSSSNSSVATVDGNGNVKAIGAGTATITATSSSNSTVKASLTVTVNKPTPPAQPTYTASSAMKTLINKGWYSDGGVPYIGDWEGMQYAEGAIYLINSYGSEGRDATLIIRDTYFNNIWGYAQTALGCFTDSASTLVSHAKNNKWGTYTYSGRKFEIFVTGSGSIAIAIGPKY